MRTTKNLHQLKFIGLSILCILLSNCKSTDEFDKYLHDEKYYKKWTPPDGVKLADNLFYDQTEMSNTNWREYLFWTQKTYGINSIEYKDALPDTAVWSDSTIFKKGFRCLKSLTHYYLRHPATNDLPVVGISQRQAVDFAKWRTDRVMEYILIANKIITWDSLPNRESCFTIERYYAGKYKNILPDKKFMYYPCFRLPVLQEWKKATVYADSIDKILCKPPQGVYVNLEEAPCKDDTTASVTPIISVYNGCQSQKKKTIYNLYGNVSEWITEEGICVGGGWADKEKIALSQDTFHLKTQNAWTGFRNVCEWKKWTK